MRPGPATAAPLGLPAPLRLAALLGRKELGNLVAYAANSAVLPLAICYSAFMLNPGAVAEQRQWLVSGIVVACGMTSLTIVCGAIVNDRLNGAARLLRSQSVSPVDYLGACLGWGVLLGFIAASLGASVMIATGLTRAGWSTLPYFIVTMLAGGLALSSLGVALAMLVRNPAEADVAVTLAGLILSVVSPLFYPLSALPAWIRPLALLSPYTHLGRLGVELAEARTPSIPSLCALALIAAVALAASAWLLRRDGP